MNNPFKLQLGRGDRETFLYMLYDACSCEIMTCTEEEIPRINDEYIFVRMNYSIPAFRTPQRSLESIK